MRKDDAAIGNIIYNIYIDGNSSATSATPQISVAYYHFPHQNVHEVGEYIPHLEVSKNNSGTQIIQVMRFFYIVLKPTVTGRDP